MIQKKNQAAKGSRGKEVEGKRIKHLQQRKYQLHTFNSNDLLAQIRAFPVSYSVRPTWNSAISFNKLCHEAEKCVPCASQKNPTLKPTLLSCQGFKKM